MAAVAQTLRGIRWQLLTALRGINLHESVLLVEHAGKRRFPHLVNGPLASDLVAQALLRLEWVIPARDHWFNTVKVYALSETGLDALQDGNAWWSSLSLLQRLILMATE